MAVLNLSNSVACLVHGGLSSMGRVTSRPSDGVRFGVRAESTSAPCA